MPCGAQQKSETEVCTLWLKSDAKYFLVYLIDNSANVNAFFTSFCGYNKMVLSWYSTQYKSEQMIIIHILMQ